MTKLCRKCLVREMDKDFYFKNLYTYIEQMEEDIKADSELYEQRLKICKSCDLLMDGMCRACGCYVELRGVIRKNYCPYEKW